jgi:hypothetical protein
MALLAFALAIDETNDPDWKQYVQKHNKSYKDHSERGKRYKIWKNASTQVKLHNSKSNKSYTQKVYFFADWTKDEISSRLNGFKIFNRRDTTTKKPSTTASRSQSVSSTTRTTMRISSSSSRTTTTTTTKKFQATTSSKSAPVLTYPNFVGMMFLFLYFIYLSSITYFYLF